MKLVIFPPVESHRLEKIVQASGSMRVVNAEDEQTAKAEIIDAEAFFGKLTPELLAVAEKLCWVQSPTASLEHYLFPELIEHPCVLTNMRGLFSDVIADHVLGYVLCFARNLHLYIRQQMNSHWEPIGGEESRASFASGPGVVTPMDRTHLHISDCTLGVIGLGNIGREISRRAFSFDMRVLGVDPVPTKKPPEVEELWELDKLPDLLKQSDFVVIAAPHTPETEGMFRRRQFQQMKETTFFINIGRGAIVSLDDLTASLAAGEIAGAALDVFEIEPLPSEHPLWKMENVIITPHVAACSIHIAERHLDVLLDNLDRFVQNKTLRNIADKKQWF